MSKEINIHQAAQYALAHWGKEHQILKAIEELTECARALSRYLAAPLEPFSDDQSERVKARHHECIDEIADARIVLAQMRQVFGAFECDDHLKLKTKRLMSKIPLDKMRATE